MSFTGLPSTYGLPAFLMSGLGPPVLAMLVLLATLGTDVTGIAFGTQSAVGGVAVVAASGAAAIGRYWGLVSQPFKRAVDSHSKRFEYAEQIGFTAEASNDINALCDVLLRRDESALIVFVDDLDRCGSRNIVEVVEAVNQIFNSVAERRCVFVLGMDLDIVATSLDVAYGDLVKGLRERHNRLGASFGRNFLAKIVQLTVSLPSPSGAAMRQYLAAITGHVLEETRDAGNWRENLVEELEAAIEASRPANPVDVFAAAQNLARDQRQGIPDDVLDEAIRRAQARRFTTESPDVARAELEVLGYLEQNPRQVKRFDNAYRLQLHVASNTPGALHDFTLDQLVALGKWVALRLRWPELATRLDRSASAISALESAANGVRSAEEPAEWITEWLTDEDLHDLLTDPREARRMSSLPLDTFLRVT